jgi:nitroreductase
MDIVKVIKARRSVRKYKPESIPADKLEIILEAARLAPSAGNRQPWRFVVVQEMSRKNAVAEAANNQAFMNDAAAIVVAVCDPEVSKMVRKRYNDRSRTHGPGGNKHGLW